MEDVDENETEASFLVSSAADEVEDAVTDRTDGVVTVLPKENAGAVVLAVLAVVVPELPKLKAIPGTWVEPPTTAV